MNKENKSSFPGSEKMLSDIVDIINDGIFMLDNDHRIIFVNKVAEEVLMCQEKNIIGKKIASFFPEDDLACFLPNLLEMSTKKNGYQGEIVLIKNGGGRLPSYLSTYYYEGKKEKNNGIILFVFNDITKFKALEKNFSESEKLAFIGKLTKGIVHEIRNPLVSLVGFSRRLCKELNDSNPNRSYLDIVNKESLKLENLLNYIEDFANLPHPKIKKENALSILNTVLEKNQEKTVGKQISLELKTEKGMGLVEEVYIDGDLLTKALNYIIDNAVNSIVSNGTMTLTAKRSGNYLNLEISDTGAGIPERYLESIFEPFFTTKEGHLGLSLSTAKRIIEELNGTMHVTSELGFGTTFHINLLRDRRAQIRRERI